MRAEVSQQIDAIQSSLSLMRRHLDWPNALKRLEELNAEAEDPSLWENQERAQMVLRDRTRLEKSIEQVRGIEQELDDAAMLIELGEAEDDSDVVAEAEVTIEGLQRRSEKLELESLLSGEVDGNDCYIEINAGAGGTESQDWAEMLARMYLRWSESHDYKIEWIEESAGEEAGIKSATFKVGGPNAYGWMKTESGVHRLVRISPYDSQSRRHTSFASVWVYPVIDDAIEIEIEDKDIRVDTYRASGAGGQHVNKTDSAVRLTHIETGIVVQCQNDRSQHRNRAQAMAMLRARLYEHETQKREAEAQAEQDSKTDIGWGHQIRSYVLHPYQMVKDLRTNVETGNAQAVLDGDLDRFLEASLASVLGKDAAEPADAAIETPDA
ncbi:MAG: peptide chain release factor 2 [Rhodospirillaceae bacterium]|nr:peptide chain release factor 2 [Alphaproteobacteria bacterium]MBT6285789.1 peptide chain release factor 2 [Rhodospirillaceae bacterium]